MPEKQRRGAKIAFTESELDEFLRSERTCRVASIGKDGSPHVTPLWFAWDGSHIWLTSIVKSQRWTDIMRNPNVSVIVDAGDDYMELRGAELRGTAELVGEAPRTGEPVPELDEPERLYSLKYRGTEEPYHDGRHAWLKVTPQKISSWDFRKMAG